MWYVEIEGRRTGPHDLEKLAQLQKRGELRPDSRVWKRGLKDWKPASETILASLFGRPPDEKTGLAMAPEFVNFKSLWSIGWIFVALQWVIVALAAGTFYWITRFLEVSAQFDAEARRWNPERFEEYIAAVRVPLEQAQVFGVAIGLLTLPVVGLLGAWYYRAVHNCRALGAVDYRHHPGLALVIVVAAPMVAAGVIAAVIAAAGGATAARDWQPWTLVAVPLVGFYPILVIGDTWRASGDHLQWRQRHFPVVVLLLSAAYLGSTALAVNRNADMVPLTNFLRRVYPQEVYDRTVALTWEVFGLRSAAAAAATALIIGLSLRQDALQKRIAKALGSGL